MPVSFVVNEAKKWVLRKSHFCDKIFTEFVAGGFQEI